MIRFLYSRGFLFFVIVLQGAFLFACAKCGTDVVYDFFGRVIIWMAGGEYAGYSVLSTAFAVNTWGVAVKSMRKSAKQLCRKYVQETMTRFRNAGYANLIESRASFASYTLDKRSRAFGRMMSFARAMEGYQKMLPRMLDISTQITVFFMVCCALVCVICMIMEVNGRFASFLLLPVPVYCIYAWIAPRWVRFVLWYKWMLLIRILPCCEGNVDDMQALKKTLDDLCGALSGGAL